MAKLKKQLAAWTYDRMVAEPYRAKRIAWLESEVVYIRGMIHRNAGIKLSSESKILQVGAGANDVIDYWDATERHAIDALANEYKQRLHEFQDKSVKYIAGVAEDLPYENNYFDVVIMRNALDHFDDPEKALREAFRVLKPNGALYVWIYLYSWRASLAWRTINALTKRFEIEPWAFTLRRIKRILAQSGFTLRYPAVEERPVANHAWPRFLSGKWLKCIVRKILGFWNRKGFSCVAIVLK